MAIEVSLDTTADPPVTCNPANKDKPAAESAINWRRASGQTFTFTDVEFGAGVTCFTNKEVHAHSITVVDNNANGVAAGDYPYTITVELNGTSYSSQKSSHPTDDGSSPMIRNQPA